MARGATVVGVTAAPESLLYNPLDPTAHTDPYPMYRRLRETDPVHLAPFGFYVLTRYSDCLAFARSPKVVSSFHEDASWARRRGGPDSSIVSSTRTWILMTDGNPHRRIRGLINHVFTARAIERLRPRIDDLVREFLAPVADGEPFDLIDTVALPLPVTVICELIGLPAEHRGQCRLWTEAIGHVVDPVITPEMSAAMNQASAEFRAFIHEQLRLRRAHPRDDVLTLLAQATVKGESLSDEEIVSNVMLLFSAGHETTVNLIGNGLLALLQHRDQWDRAVAEGGITDDGVDELARYDAPVQLVARMTTEDVHLGDAVVPAGSKTMLLLGAANRDPEQFPDPDRLDLGRRDARPASFGGGPHYCIGALLGRLETGIALNHLLRRHRVELATDEPQWRPNVNFRGLAELPVSVVPR
jgi:cytochrome P450